MPDYNFVEVKFIWNSPKKKILSFILVFSQIKKINYVMFLVFALSSVRIKLFIYYFLLISTKYLSLQNIFSQFTFSS